MATRTPHKHPLTETEKEMAKYYTPGVGMIKAGARSALQRITSDMKSKKYGGTVSVDPLGKGKHAIMPTLLKKRLTIVNGGKSGKVEHPEMEAMLKKLKQ